MLSSNAGQESVELFLEEDNTVNLLLGMTTS